MSTTIGGIRIVDMPDLGGVDDTSSMVGERAGSGRFSATALRSYIGANYVPLSGGAVANAGVFDGNGMHDTLSVMVNGASSLTEFQFAYPGQTSVEAFAAGLVVPAGMTAYSANAISAYLQNASTAADFAAGVRSYVRNTAPGATSYALHLKATDQTTAAPVASTVVGTEIDIGAYSVASRAIGSNVIGSFPNGTPALAVANQVLAANAAPWVYGFITADGAAEVAFAAGSAKVVAPRNSDSPTDTIRGAGTIQTPEAACDDFGDSHRRRG